MLGKQIESAEPSGATAEILPAQEAQNTRRLRATRDIEDESPSLAPTGPVSNFEPLLSADELRNVLSQPATLSDERSDEAAQAAGPNHTVSVHVEQARTPATKTAVEVQPVNAPRRLAQETVPPEAQKYRGTTAPPQPPRQTSTPSLVAAAAASAHDEIQIHIGRIEVTAIPPPARPAAQKPANNGPSLQEYLKRRDRSVQ